MKSFQVNIVTPERVVWAAGAVSVTLPGSEGYLGIWADHAPLVTIVVPGVITIKLDDTGRTQLLACSGGFAEISRNTVNVMTDSCEEAGQIDAARAKAAYERARERLRSADSTIDRESVLQAKERAEARLKVLDLMER
ncbi:MAG TPA: ATP synthase F1 subunit epsilon [Candidatus Krumholzibacteria bacterium]|nr:ATP synthase F1 subunit epsilon [Candidatus Krumholzibacteria bacterium]HPD73034.1 ATP synthase F1 subunit epsilon [Candidatus Krumholzibacteria bacterium]HRY41833.1 ATP synthase F1 subunit epsilon [Candidatus Krumholzibacteria bacterium]